MNIEDVKETPDNPKDIMKAIHDKQEELMIKYKDMGDTPPWPLKLDLSEHQIAIKDFKQRGMEEVAEAIEAFRKEETMHFAEELIDALHFFVELNILVDKREDFFEVYNFTTNESGLSIESLYTMNGKLSEKYGLLCNTLKNKPWKNTHIPTDKKRFYELLKESFEYFIYMLHECGFNMEEIYNVYFKKHKVNNFRIRSNY